MGMHPQSFHTFSVFVFIIVFSLEVKSINPTHKMICNTVESGVARPLRIQVLQI